MQIDPAIWAGIISGLFTLGTGWFAIRVFYLQKKTEKINAAISILFEIRNAEAKIDIISQKLDRNDYMDFPSVLGSNNWRKYSHLFVKDFDEDELQQLNAFYVSAEIIEDLVGRQNNFVWLAAEERSRVAQKLLGDIQVQLQEEVAEGGTAATNAPAKFNNTRRAITEFYTGDEFFYAPQRAISSLHFQINHLPKITTTICGAKLKRLTRTRT